MQGSPYTLRNLGEVCGGDHICYFCTSDEEKWRVLCQFYKRGLQQNEKMMFFQHSTPEEEVLSRLEAGGVTNIRECVTRGQFRILYYADVYMTNGKFTPEKMVSRLNSFSRQCTDEGFSALRFCGDMSWVHKEQNLTSKLLSYESMLNQGFPDAYASLCMYDVRDFKPADMLQVLATHPQTIINEKLLHNIYYMPPDEYLGADIDRAMFNRWMYNIEERKNVEEQLIAARIEAEKAAHAKANFLATMSHEIRNPTNGIIGSVDMLAQTNVTHEQLEYVNIIRTSSKHLYRVVNDVLDFSKIESGKLELSMEPLFVKDVLEDSRRLCQYSIQKNLAVTLRCHYHPMCPETIFGDETRLRQILVNLIGNACKFTEGEIVVSVVPAIGPILDVEGAGEGGKQTEGIQENVGPPYLEFSVSDSGAGICEDDMSKLFTKFTQIDVTQKFAGTGLGLAICKQLVEAMGGKIVAKSVIGKGSIFYFRIPTAPPLIRRPSTPSASSAPTTPSAPSFNLAMPHNVSHSSSPVILSPDPLYSPNIFSPRSSPTKKKPCANILRSSSPIFSPPCFSTPIPISRTNSFSSIPASPLSSSPPLGPLTIDGDPPTSCTTKAFDFSDDHVLVVEDDVTNQKVLCHMLRKLKCRVTVASNGLEAISLTKHHDFSLILTDQYMPKCDGFAAMIEIRAYFAAQDPASSSTHGFVFPAPSSHDHASHPERLRKCPTIVVCTGTYEERLTEVTDDILIKPIRFKTISEILSRYGTNKAA